MSSASPLTKNTLQDLADYGQSVWLDYIRRNLITSGELARLVAQDGLAGVTSNPSIFEKAISGSTDYSDALAALESEPHLDAMTQGQRQRISERVIHGHGQAHVTVERRGGNGTGSHPECGT